MSNYDNKFYSDIATRLDSSKEILNFFFNILKPKSVLDVGCGRGAWLKTAKELGVNTIYGIDGNWNDGKEIDKEIVFKSVELNNSFNLDRQFDLTLCLEVVEHLKKDSAENIISSLVKTSNIILFSAAFKYQGGVGHVNENLHSYWANLFFKYNFLPFDIVRPIFWDNKKVAYWYRQNTFLYVKKNCNEFEKLLKDYDYLKNYRLMDSIHPEMYFRKVESQSIKYHLKQIIQKLIKKLI